MQWACVMASISRAASRPIPASRSSSFFVAPMANRGPSWSRRANRNASGINSSWGTTLFAKPIR